MTYHDPVMLKESIEALDIKSGGVYVDATYGGGGHSKEILKHLSSGKLIAFDQDDDAEKNKLNDERFVFVKHNFIHLKRFLKFHDLSPVQGVLADLGVSSHQFDTAERGFSTRFEAELDMRMNKDSKLTAKKILNTYKEEHLTQLFSEFGEIPNAKRLAKAIIDAREKNVISTVNELKEAIKSCVFAGKENQYLAQVFQALRIETNKELDALKKLLVQSAQSLASGGRLVVISYHSLEDRLVKSFMMKGTFEGDAEKDIYGNRTQVQFRMISKKAIMPSEEEIRKNPRARSARMRVAEKILKNN